MHSHFLLQGIFLTQGSNPGVSYFRQILYRLSPPGKSKLIKQSTIHERSLSFLYCLEMSQVKLQSSKCSPCPLTMPGCLKLGVGVFHFGEAVNWYTTMGTVWRFLKKLNVTHTKTADVDSTVDLSALNIVAPWSASLLLITYYWEHLNSTQPNHIHLSKPGWIKNSS